MYVTIDPRCHESYKTFLRIKRLPAYRIRGRQAWFPDEYAEHIGETVPQKRVNYSPGLHLFDYQADISKLAIEKRKFAVFAECGLGKTLILLEFAKHSEDEMPGKCVLIVSPLMVVEQTIAEAKRFYPNTDIQQVAAKDLQKWLSSGSGIGITNYEAIRPELRPGNLGALILDESSLLKSHYGKWGTKLIELGKGLNWKLALTGTPAPNDRIEYANHAVFLDRFPTVNSFLARYFVNRGQTQNRWELRPHALTPFYRSLADWCIFLNDPATYGWKDNCDTVPPIKVHIHHVDLTDEQRAIVSQKTGKLFIGNDLGGIASRASLASVAKGWEGKRQVETNKYEFIRQLVSAWPDEGTIIWALYNEEQRLLEQAFPEAASITGSTKHEIRMEAIDSFKSGRKKVLISKPKILGYGLNLQVATRQVFSGLQDSYESYWQCVKRSNRIGSTKPLNVHIPVTEIEQPMVDNVLRKAHRVQQDTETQEELFRQIGGDFLCRTT